MRFIFFFFSLILISVLCYAQEFDDLNNQAYKERDNKNYQKAIELSTQSLNKKVNARAYIIRGDCRFQLGDYQAAIDDNNSALTWYSEYYGSDNKEKASLYYYLGRCKQQLKRYNEAITDFGTAVSYNYEYAGYAYWNRASCYQDLGKYKEADEDYSKAIDRMSDNSLLSRIYKSRGDCQIQLYDYDKAYSMYDRAIYYNPKNYLAYWQRGYYKGIDFKYTDELADYTKAIDIINGGGTSATNTDLAQLYRNKAISLRSQLRYDEALIAINKALEADPNMARSYRTRGDIYSSLKNYEKARSNYESAISLTEDKKTRSDIFLDRSMMFWNILDYKNCLEDLNKAIENDPSDGMNYWHRSMLYGYKKNYPLAIKECDKGIEIYKASSSSYSEAGLHKLRASHKENSGDFKGAADDLLVYIQKYPNSHEAYYDLGRLYKWKLKNNDLAEANLSKALSLAEKDKDSIQANYIKLVKGNKDEALMNMLEIMKLTPESNEYRYKWNLHNLTCMYSLVGNTTKAFEYLDKSLKAGFDDYLHLINDRDLVSLMKLPQWKAVLTKYKVPTVKN